MARGRVNTAGIMESGTFNIVPEGRYYARIAEVVPGKSQAGDPMFSVKLLIVAGESQDSWLWDNIVISDNPNSPGYKILGRSKHFLHCIGEPYEGEIDYDTENWIDKEVEIKVYHDSYKGKPKAKVEEYILEEKGNTPQEESPF